MQGNKHLIGSRALLVGGVLALLATASASAALRTPVQTVGQYQETLLAVMKNADTLGFARRYARLKTAIEETFDLPFIAQIAVGRHWRRMTDQQRERYVAAYGRFSVTTFARRFGGYSGERFVIVGKSETRRKDVLVRTKIVKPNGDAVEINYLLRKHGDAWRIIDVFLDGAISELAMRRAEFGSVIRRDGLDKLIDAIESKIKDLATNK